MTLCTRSSGLLQTKGRQPSSGEQLFCRGLQVSQVPEDPEDQADKDEERSREDEEIPEVEGSKDPDEEQDQACSVHEDGDEEKQQTSAQVRGVIHDKKKKRKKRKAAGCAYAGSKLFTALADCRRDTLKMLRSQTN